MYFTVLNEFALQQFSGLMMYFANLDIEIERTPESKFSVVLKFTRSDSQVQQESVSGEADFRFEILEGFKDDAVEYGQTLANMLLADPNITAAFMQHRHLASGLAMPLRIRMHIGQSAPELHRLRWECLRLPDGTGAMCNDENLRFSRYVPTRDTRPVTLRPKQDLQALALIAAPADIETFRVNAVTLAQIDAEGENRRFLEGIGDLTHLVLKDDRATQANLLSELRNGYDILYLVCHGAFVEGKSSLYLVSDRGTTAVVTGEEFCNSISQLEHRPRLVVLASCQSSGDDGLVNFGMSDALKALAPQLIQSGVPAVLGMQGNVSMETIKIFMPKFFEELRRDGRIDRAMATARAAVAKRDDWWVPSLFMSLKEGRIDWYDHGFAGESGSFDRWGTLVTNIRAKDCTPILGFGLLEGVVGSLDHVAARFKRDEQPGFDTSGRGEFPRIAQHLSVLEHEHLVQSKFEQALGDGAWSHGGERLGVDRAEVSAVELISNVGAARRENNENDPYSILSSLDLPVYLTANPDDLLFDALKAAGKEPHSKVFLEKKEEEEEMASVTASRFSEVDATPDKPLVYHFFGHLREPKSLILTEDNFFDFLIDSTKDWRLIPRKVSRRLSKSALLFLGFQLDDWSFRVLFRSIIKLDSAYLQSKYSHVCVQIDPQKSEQDSPAELQRYLGAYFQKNKTPISIYWGTAEDFLKDLSDQLTPHAH